jgi:8-oxo-dGTP pyrophosphatase MutT (NUDIX family)
MEITKWDKLSTRYLVREKWATLRVDTCKLPNGKIKDDYYVLEYPNWVNAIALTSDHKIILVKQYRFAADIISLELPGGVIDDGENAETAIKRELIEETGYTFEHCEKLVDLYPNPATATNITTTYLLTGGKKTHEQHFDEHEIINVELHTITELKSLLKENKISQALHVAGMYYGLEKLAELGIKG